jgi:hypothetical protein
MEPGHPPRQDPPTGHSHDQVNGAPPRPGSRRGWMSDSPLDGGSGWPTSAYMIVPRQPAAPAQESTAEEPEEAPQELATIVEPSKKGRIAALVVGIIVLIIAAVGGVLATRDTSSSGKSGQPETITSPTVDATTAGPSADPSVDASGSAVPYLGGSAAGSTTPDPSGSPDPGAVVLSPLPENTVILHAGTVWIALLVGRPDDMFDLDAGVKQTAGADISAGALGLTATNGAYFAPWTAVEFPSLAGCSAVPAAQWTTQILLAALVLGAKACVRSSELRFGWFTPRGGDAVVSGAIYTTYLDFTVYRKTGD